MLFCEGGLSFRFTWPNWVRGISCWVAWAALRGRARHRDASTPQALALAAHRLLGVDPGLAPARATTVRASPLHQLWVPAVLPLVAGVVALAARLNRRVDWRGRSYDLDGEARLGAERLGAAAGT